MIGIKKNICKVFYLFFSFKIISNNNIKKKMNFSQEERAGKAGHNGFRVMNPPGGKSNWSPYTQFQETPSLRDNRPTNFSHQGQQQ